MERRTQAKEWSHARTEGAWEEVQGGCSIRDMKCVAESDFGTSCSLKCFLPNGNIVEKGEHTKERVRNCIL